MNQLHKGNNKDNNGKGKIVREIESDRKRGN